MQLQQSYLRTPKTSVELNGTVSGHSQLQVELQSADLHELELLVDEIKRSVRGATPEQLGLHGTGAFTGVLSGRVTDPQIAGQLVVHNLRVKGSAWDLLQAGIRADSSLLSLSDGRLQSARLGGINFNLRAGLEKWAYSVSSPIGVTASASRISLADLLRLAGGNYPVSGDLAVDIQIHGSQLNPVGRGSLHLARASILGQPVQDLDLRFQGDGKLVKASMSLRTKAGRAQASATYYPESETYQGEVKASDILLGQLEVPEVRDLQLGGTLDLDARSHGRLSSPEFEAMFDIPELHVRRQTIHDFRMQAREQNYIAEIILHSEIAAVQVSGHGTVGIKAPYTADLTLDSGSVALRPLLAIFAPAAAEDVSGRTELHLTLQGPLAERDRLQAHLTLPVLTATYAQAGLSSTKPVLLDYVDGEVVLRPTSIQGTGTHIDLQARIPVADPAKAFFLAQGTVDLGVAHLFYPDLQCTGQLQIDIDSRRYTQGSNLAGVIKIVNASLRTAGLPWGMENANGIVTVTRDHLQVNSFQANVAGGSVTATGGIAYRPAMQFNLAVQAKEVRLTYPQGLRSRLDANLSLTGTDRSSTLGGQVRISDVSFLPDFNLGTFADQFETPFISPALSDFEQNLHLSIAVQSTSQMNLESSKLSISGSLTLRVAGTAAVPVVLGRMALNGGDVFLAGNRYVIQSGAIDFVNPVRIEPVMNLRLQTTVDQYSIALNINGPMDRLRMNYSSDPALPPADIINLLAFGTTTEGGTSPSGTLGAETLLAKGVSSVVSSRLERFAGLSHFSIDPALGGNNQSPVARIAIQKRVTSNMYVTYATDVTSTQRQAIELKYQLNRRWSVSAVRDQNGGFGADVHYRKNF